jgi:hypothetical protein
MSQKTSSRIGGTPLSEPSLKILHAIKELQLDGRAVPAVRLPDVEMARDVLPWARDLPHEELVSRLQARATRDGAIPPGGPVRYDPVPEHLIHAELRDIDHDGRADGTVNDPDFVEGCLTALRVRGLINRIRTKDEPHAEHVRGDGVIVTAVVAGLDSHLTLSDVREGKRVSIPFEAEKGGQSWAYSLTPEGLAILADPKRPAQHAKRRARRTKGLTPLQQRALELYAEHNGDIGLVSVAMGVTRPTVHGHLKAAWRKVPNLAPKDSRRANRTGSIPSDQRGQANIAEDRRRR